MKDDLSGADKIAAKQALAGNDLTVNRFRSARGKLLREKIVALRASLGRDITVLDVGGREDYWGNVGTKGIAKIVLQNIDPVELETAPENPLFVKELGDACDMPHYADNSFDLVHSNSVIEHVGAFPKMEAMAQEVVRVGAAGWIQTPSFAFPIEPHFRMPFAHWLPEPLRRAYVKLRPNYRQNSISKRRADVDGINLVTYSEVVELFPHKDVWIERLAFWPKSYVVRW